MKRQSRKVMQQRVVARKRRNVAHSPRPKFVRTKKTVNKGVNRDNTLANWVTEMTARAAKVAKQREPAVGWGDDTI